MSMQYRGVQIKLLDGSDLARSIYKRTTTKEIMENIFQTLGLIEKDYFGLYYVTASVGERVWLKDHKTVWGQIVKNLEPPYQLFFGVRYFPYDPLVLQEDLTLYLVYLQLRREVKEGRVICSEGERAEMLAYIFQAEGGDDGSKFTYKHRNFFNSLSKCSPDIENAVLETHNHLKGTEAPECEMRLMDKALPLTFYNQEMHNVRSDAQPGLKRLTLTLGPIGIGLYQGTVKLDIYSWMEIWNVGYINKTFWFRIVRDGEKSKHKYHFDDKKTCRHVWKQFRIYFRFYTQQKKIDPKLLWGRVPPKVNRVVLGQGPGESHVPSYAHFGVGASMSPANISNLAPTSYHSNGEASLLSHQRNKTKGFSGMGVQKSVQNPLFVPDIMSGGGGGGDMRFSGPANDAPNRFFSSGNNKNNFAAGFASSQVPRVQFTDD